MLAASAVSLVRRGRSTASNAVASGTTISTMTPIPRASTTVSLIASSGQTAMSCAVLPKTCGLRRAHWAGWSKIRLTVALIVLERVAYGLDDGARRDRRAGECIEIAAVASHGPALRRRIRQRAAAKARRASARRATRTHRRGRASRRGESPARRSGVRPGRSRRAARSARDSRPERSDRITAATGAPARRAR